MAIATTEDEVDLEAIEAKIHEVGVKVHIEAEDHKIRTIDLIIIQIYRH